MCGAASLLVPPPLTTFAHAPNGNLELNLLLGARIELYGMQSQPFRRHDRVGDQILRELANIISRELNDARAKHATLSGIEVSRDLSQAKVFVTPALGRDGDEDLKVLNKAAGFVRKLLGQRLRARRVPALKFCYDPTLDNANRLDVLLAEQLPTTHDTPASLEDSTDGFEVTDDGSDEPTGGSRAP